jgi:16S rRNA (guanine966-N2)-methyltransferase
MRVIAGTAGGLRLVVPKTDIRPTMDRVKAAIFSSLGERVIGSRVLDLFAGSGALGIEALSRGAAFVMFVENDRTAVAAIEHNLAQTGLIGRVRKQDVFDFLSHASTAEPYDLILADPPYDESKLGETFTKLLLRNDRLPARLTSEGIFVLEKRPGERLPANDFWEVTRRKTYGATETIFLRSVGAGGADSGRAKASDAQDRPGSATPATTARL